MENGMRVELNVEDKITSVDLVDQLLRARLEGIRKELEVWNDCPEELAACKTLLAWMYPPTGD
jgi:hypothetical protein